MLPAAFLPLIMINNDVGVSFPLTFAQRAGEKAFQTTLPFTSWISSFLLRISADLNTKAAVKKLV